jgi:hypothetical protein
MHNRTLGSERALANSQSASRHMEDGCSKRFDIGTLDLRADAFDSLHPSTRTMAPLGPLLPSSGGLPPMATPPLCSSSVFPSLPPTMRPREPLAAGDHSQGHSWGR